MNRQLKTSLLVALMGLTSGCATMHFTQGEPVDREAAEAQNRLVNHWHHSMLNGTVEISKPANLYKTCRGKQWDRVTIEFQAKNGVAGVVANAALDTLLIPLDLLAYYSPWTVEIECSK